MIFETYTSKEEGFFGFYQKLFIETFGEWKPHRPPDFIYIVRDGESIGWAEGLIRKPWELFMLYGGVPKNQHGRIINVKGYQALLEKLHNDGWKSLMTEIENTNKAMLKLAITSGFLINGARVASNGTVVVTLYKTQKENTL